MPIDLAQNFFKRMDSLKADLEALKQHDPAAFEALSMDGLRRVFEYAESKSFTQTVEMICRVFVEASVKRESPFHDHHVSVQTDLHMASEHFEH